MLLLFKASRCSLLWPHNYKLPNKLSYVKCLNSTKDNTALTKYTLSQWRQDDASPSSPALLLSLFCQASAS